MTIIIILLLLLLIGAFVIFSRNQKNTINYINDNSLVQSDALSQIIKEELSEERDQQLRNLRQSKKYRLIEEILDQEIDKMSSTDMGDLTKQYSLNAKHVKLVSFKNYKFKVIHRSFKIGGRRLIVVEVYPAHLFGMLFSQHKRFNLNS